VRDGGDGLQCFLWALKEIVFVAEGFAHNRGCFCLSANLPFQSPQLKVERFLWRLGFSQLCDKVLRRDLEQRREYGGFCIESRESLCGFEGMLMYGLR